MSVFVRVATAGDQQPIVRIIRAARINPTGLRWPQFVVAQQAGALVGVGQVKQHADGSRELASIAVVPAYQGQGIGSVIIRALLLRERGPLYLMTTSEKESFYRRFGFCVVDPAALPRSLAFEMRVGRLYVGLRSRLEGKPVRLIAMRRADPAV